ncbi:glycosyltransferase [Lysobacter sp. cf310]|uniref:glycosyltransferase n=1 Tax=Lysobacter sp. cf310 TaxID=1761790 RepID=UPI0008EE5992|nr:glycosyltransferase [Lysobacter sp. cf310]SFL14656.1 Glycosyltransferase, catalytic subunit of cellulose synthase and poly-beta-1,6-N-acetylglucosamine synthase [Lysobacter sp. cf310]
MPALPWFALSPNGLLSAVGLWRGSEETVPTPVEDWRQAVVDVVIPARLQQHDIAHCLAALLAQTLQPRKVVLVDDGGTERDGTAAIAREFAAANGLSLRVIERMWSIGRGPTIKRQARESDADVEFVLDGDTLLHSADYIERCVRELYEGVGIASVCGVVQPMRGEHRRALERSPAFQRWLHGEAYRDPRTRRGRLRRSLQWLGDIHRETSCLLQQCFINRGQMALFGGVVVPRGNAIAYRRRYIKDLFDRYEPVHGDQFDGAEDVFVALALAQEGYRNVQLFGVLAHAEQPPLDRLPGQSFRQAGAFLRGCREFNALLLTPFKVWRRWLRPRPRVVAEQRRVREAYRQPFGGRLTHEYGRPIGWALFLMAGERLAYPLLLLWLVFSGRWWWLGGVVLAEILATALVLASVARDGRGAALGKALLVAPVRYAMVFVELAAAVAFLPQRFRRPRRGR